MATARIATTMMSLSRHSLNTTHPFPLQNLPIYKHVQLLCPIAIKTSSSSPPNRVLVKAAENGGSASGVETSITEAKDSVVAVRNATFVMESRDHEKVKVRVDLTGEDTKFAFEKVLRNLAKTAPPVPGFRKQKGGKTSRVPTPLLLQILGETTVTNFVIREIVTTTLGEYAKNENLSVKDNKVSTIQTAEELKGMFSPGDVFGFNAVIELEEVGSEGGSEGVDGVPEVEGEGSSEVGDEVKGVEGSSVVVDEVSSS